MTQGHLTTVMRHLRRLIGEPAAPADTDGRLLERFLQSHEEDAFAQLMQRHGPLVMGVCRRVLRDAHAAEDAFQATFLLLARKAHSLRRHDSLAGWLSRVAFRVALDARAAGDRRAARERMVVAMAPTQTDTEADRHQRRLILEEELQALPRKYYEPLVLCYLESRTHEEAARLLRWPEGTVKGRMARGREMLRQRLIRRGLTLGSGGLTTLLAEESALAAVAPSLAADTLRAALLITSGQAAGAVAAPVAVLVDGVLHAWWLARVKLAAAVVFCGIVATGLGIGLGPLRQSAFVQPTADGTNLDAGQAQAPPIAELPTVDLQGDPLPPEALARLGTLRFRAGPTVRRLAISPDGKVMASVGNGGLQVWDTDNGKLLRQLGDGYNQHISFTADRTLTSASPGKVRSWSAHGEKELRQLDLKEVDAKRLVALTGIPGGREVVGLSGDLKDTEWELHVWELDTGRELRSWPVAASTGTLALSPDGSLLATTEGAKNRPGILGDSTNADQTIRLWDPATGKSVRIFPACNQNIENLTFSPDGSLLASGGQLDPARPQKEKKSRNAVILWDVGMGQEVTRFEGQEASSSCPVAFTPDGKTLALGDVDTIRLWDVTQRRAAGELRGHQSIITALTISRDGRLLVSADDDGQLRQWHLATSKEAKVIYGHQSSVGPIAWTRDGTALATCADQSIRFWDPRTGKLRRQIGPVPRAFLTDYTFARDLSFLLVVEPSRFQVWDLAQGKMTRELKIEKETWAREPALSPDNRQFAVASNLVVDVWDVATGKVVHRLETHPVPAPGWHSVYSPDGKLLVTSEPGGGVFIWDAATGKRLHLLTLSSENNDFEDLLITSLAFSPDSKWLTVACRGGAITFWDAASGTLLRTIRTAASTRDANLGRLCYAPDGKTFAVGNARTVQWWELATGKMIREFHGHQGEVGQLAFAPDCQSLASGSQDSTVLIWDLFRPTAAELQQAGRLGETELANLWHDLGQTDAATGHAAVRVLLANPRIGLPYLQKHLTPVAGPTAERLGRLLADLGGEQFATRQQAEQELGALGELAEPILTATLAGKPSLEVTRRIERLLARLQQQPPPDTETLRGLRAVVVLEHAHVPEAKPALELLAKGAPAARVTKEARRALERLAR
jgi:RNA polymerase sigma factor (sigma-70 family)